jgi:hypothetical protein
VPTITFARRLGQHLLLPATTGPDDHVCAPVRSERLLARHVGRGHAQT